MALLSTASPGLCLARATTLGRNEPGGVSIGRRVQQHGPRAACLAASQSTHLFGGSKLAVASRKQTRRVRNLGIRAEGGNQKYLDTWIGRSAMLTFAWAVGLEITTGKGLLEAAGLPKPVPAPALGLVALAGVVTAWGVFRSTASD